MQLIERLQYHIDILNEGEYSYFNSPRSNKSIEVLSNPTKKELYDFLKDHKSIRVVHDEKDKKWYFWPANGAIHYDFNSQFLKRFDTTSANVIIYFPNKLDIYNAVEDLVFSDKCTSNSLKNLGNLLVKLKSMYDLKIKNSEEKKFLIPILKGEIPPSLQEFL